MAFREKTAWLTLVTMLIAYGAYFGIVGPQVDFGARHLADIIWTFGAVAAAHAMAMIVGCVVLAIMARREAQASADERDHAIERRGTAIAYYVLIVGIVLVGVVLPFSGPPWRIINAALGVLVLAEVVHQGVVVLSYRRGWHG
jgi:uncharacterized BrkB/YihY/UPF0761 family membrane protein